MEVKTADDAAFSLKAAIRYSAICCFFGGVVLLPALVFTGYGSLLNTLILIALLGLVGRTLVSSVFSFAPPDPPLDDLSDSDLPSVSILIPAYNEEPVLPGTIKACKNLDYPEAKLEVVICYEADSTDATAAIAKGAAAEDSRFVAVERDEAGGGKAKATNYGLRYTSGEIIASIDADHQFRPDAIRRAVAWFRSDEDLWCIKGRCYGRNPTDSVLALHATVERHIAERIDIYARQTFRSFTFFGGGQAFFRREVFNELGDFDEEILVEDIDMSMKIQAAGKGLRVDPQILTYEENPATLSSWWNQRKRWARGWMQVAVRYLPTLHRQPKMSYRTKVDTAYTLVYAVVPVFTAFALPMLLLNLLTEVRLHSYLPGSLWTVVSVATIVVSAVVFLQDRLVGEHHHPTEYIAAVTLWFYFLFQSFVFVTAFIDEFILDAPSVYVTTSRTGENETTVQSPTESAD